MIAQKNDPICEVRSFAERDIDVWLAEELRVNSIFARWFAERANLPAEIQTPAMRTRTSVASENGETDVEALFGTASGRKIGLLIENKIEHSVSADQIRRYFDRGLHGIKYGHWDEFSILVFAPSAKLAKYASIFDKASQISFEDAAAFLATTATDSRTSYRSAFLQRASIEREVEVDGADAFRVSFWKKLYEMVDQKFPGFFALDRAKFPKTTYIAANCIGSPNYFRVDLKGHMGEVDLAFSNFNPGPLLNFLEENRPKVASVVFNKRSIALQIGGLPKFFAGDGIEIIESRALKSFEAAYTLLNFWKDQRKFFDEHYAAADVGPANPGTDLREDRAT
jgi:hypothetical protein